MSSSKLKPTLKLKLVVDVACQKVLFAEAGKDVVNLLFSILALPMGYVVRLLGKESMVGCLGKLYQSWINLENLYVQPNQRKIDLLSPSAASHTIFRSAAALIWKEVDFTPTLIVYRCLSCFGDEFQNPIYRYYSDVLGVTCPGCSNKMETEMMYVLPPVDEKEGTVTSGTDAENVGFVNGLVMYTVTDNLEVSPISAGSDVKDVGSLEQMTVDLDMSKAREMLKASLHSTTVLTDIFFAKKLKRDREEFGFAHPSPEVALAYPINTESTTMSSSKLEPTLKLKLIVDMVQRKVLFTEVGKDAIDFLFSILALPLGKVVQLRRQQSMEGSLGNLYGSVESLDDAYVQANLSKSHLLTPRVVSPVIAVGAALTWKKVDDHLSLGTYYWCENHCGFFSDDTRAVCRTCGRNMAQLMTYVPPPAVDGRLATATNLGAAGGEGGLVKGGIVRYMVMDDLAVVPQSISFKLALLKECRVTKVDRLEEMTVILDMSKALQMLNASLQSSTVFTDVFLGKKFKGDPPLPIGF